jgi:pyrroline-5-carboxylate reductase
MSVKKIGIIGCGNMGSAIIRGLLRRGKGPGKEIFVNDLVEEKTLPLVALSGVQTLGLDELVSLADILIISIKPQDFLSLASRIKNKIRKDILIISIMAGINIDTISSNLGIDTAVVRAMPNMPAVIGEGMTCFACNNKVVDKDIVVEAFEGIGRVLEIREEEMDTVTAISGSGPAYFFYVADAMIKNAMRNGFTPTRAFELVSQTFFGAAKLLKESSGQLEEQISTVASKGGTTEAALNVFKDKKLDLIISEAVDKARERSKKLSQG